MTEPSHGLETIADRHGVSPEAARHLVRALEAGQGRMAQFNHPELGGFGQWSGSGMTMIGDMFNTGLKARVDALCTALADALPPPASRPGPSRPRRGRSGRLNGAPATSGAQNGLRYAYFPDHRRLAVETQGQVALYDTGEHAISGVAQQQGGSTSLRFSGPGGPVDLAALKRLDGVPQPETRPFAPEPFAPEPLARESVASSSPGTEPSASAAAPGPSGDVLTIIERLSDLQRKGVLTEAEFAAKKAELLARL